MATHYNRRRRLAMPVDRPRQFHQGYMAGSAANTDVAWGRSGKSLPGLVANYEGGALPVSIVNSLLVLALALVAGDARSAKSPAPDAPQASYPFTFDTLMEDAKRRAATPY